MGGKLLLKRFLEQCSRTGSQETKDGYRRELRHLTRWCDLNHPHLHLRDLDSCCVGVPLKGSIRCHAGRDRINATVACLW